jgi:hypothetical protein
MTPLEFLRLLWLNKPEGHFVLLWTLPEKRSRWFREILPAADYIETVRDRDVYVGVGLSKQDFGPVHRCVSDEISGLTGFWADLDLRSDAHTTKALPESIADALSIIPASMPPTLVIVTGNGAHAWWLFKEPYIFDNDEDRKATACLVARWSTLLRLNAARRGWVFDRLSDLARVLRVPGTRNHKDPASPKDVVVHSRSDARYNLSDFAEFLDDCAIPDPEAQEKAAREWAERFADKPLVIDPNARIPQEMLDGWMAEDMRFRNTWHRQRHDLKDQSQSGYDLALADFGIDAGLPEQRIVDLINHHRSQYSQRPRTRVDYFQRTIARAARRSDWRGTPSLPEAVTAPAAPTSTPVAPQLAAGAPVDGGPRDTPTADPNVAKALLCDRISQALGIRVLRLVKLTGKEPTYHMELPEGKIEFAHVGKFISQDAVRLAVAGQMGKLIAKIKPKLWDQVAQAMLDACIVDEGGEEVEWEGAARMYVAQYLSETGFIETVEKQMVQNQRKPMVIDGHIAICASDLQIYIGRTMFQTLTVKAVSSMLKALGGKHIRVRGSKHKEQSRWSLPTNEFDPEDYPSMAHREDVHAARSE